MFGFFNRNRQRRDAAIAFWEAFKRAFQLQTPPQIYPSASSSSEKSTALFMSQSNKAERYRAQSEAFSASSALCDDPVLIDYAGRWAAAFATYAQACALGALAADRGAAAIDSPRRAGAIMVVEKMFGIDRSSKMLSDINALTQQAEQLLDRGEREVTTLMNERDGIMNYLHHEYSLELDCNA